MGRICNAMFPCFRVGNEENVIFDPNVSWQEYKDEIWRGEVIALMFLRFMALFGQTCLEVRKSLRFGVMIMKLFRMMVPVNCPDVNKNVLNDFVILC